MKKQFMKSIRDNMPDCLNYCTAPLFRNKLIHNNEFRRYIKLLEERERSGRENVKEYQFNQLKDTLIYSFVNVPYYNELFRKVAFDPFRFSDFSQMEKIPFLTRDMVLNNFDKLRSTKKIENGYYVGLTGGSTGLPLKFLLDYDSIYKENAFIYHYRKRLGYDFNDKIATFRNRAPSKVLWKSNPMYGEIMFSNTRLSKINVRKYADKMNRLKPQYLNGYISAIWFFTKLLEEFNLDLDFKIRGIFLISESPDQEQRKFIENYFQVKSSTFYGHSERTVIAEEIRHDEYVFDPYYGYTEQIPLENNEYTIAGTGFLNRIMPLIRYKTDDFCYPEGQHFKILGKRNSAIGLHGINNEFLTGTAFYLSLEAFQKIITYQFIQRERGKADMSIIVKKDFHIDDLKIIRQVIDLQTKGVIDINIKIVDNMVLTQRGKFQKYISYVEQT